MEEKSRRSGKFNVVDIVILAIVLVGLVFVGMKFLGSRNGGGSAPTRIEYTVLVEEVLPDVCETVMEYRKANVQLMANGELVDGHVVDISYQPHINYEPNDAGVVTPSKEEGEGARMDMIFTIQATVENPVTCKVGTQEVRIGKSHIVKTAEFEMEGYPTTTLTKEVIEE